MLARRLCDPPELSSSDSSGPHESNAAVVTADLSETGIGSIIHITLLLADSILAVLATSASDESKTTLLFLHVTALQNGNVMRRPAPTVSDINSIAVSSSSTPTRSDAQLFACMTGSSNVLVYRVSESQSTLVTQVPVAGAISLALSGGGNSDGEAVLAVGTSRGNVFFLDATSGTKVGTIVEVESGWLPCNAYFAGENYLFTTYEMNGNTKHVMWHLERKNDAAGKVNEVSVNGCSPLEELCYSMRFDDEEEDVTPSIMFWYIDDWRLAIVATSNSSDIKIIAQTEDGSWAIYELGDSKEAVLPLVDGEDTLPIGMAFDLNNTEKIPGFDLEDPVDIYPMPTLVILTTVGVVMSYRLVDDHRGASCSLVREPTSLPPLPQPIPEAVLAPTAIPSTSEQSPSASTPWASPIPPTFNQSIEQPQSATKTQSTFSSPAASSFGSDSATPKFGANSATAPKTFGIRITIQTYPHITEVVVTY